MYEVEFKVETTKEKQEEVGSLLLSKGFTQHTIEIQNNYSFDSKESIHGGYDLKRFRDTGDKIIFTEKKWEKFGEELIRKEDEREVTRQEFEHELSKHEKFGILKKTRQTYSGSWEGRDVHVDMDTVKFDHCDHDRYFIEAEIVVKEKEEVKTTHEFVKEFLSEILQQKELVESPGMHTMVVKKL